MASRMRTTPSRCLGVTAPSRRDLLDIPSAVSIIGIRLAELRRHTDQLDRDFDSWGPEWDRLLDEQAALTDQAMTLRPETLADAGTLALCSLTQLVYLAECPVEREEAEPIYARLLTAVRGILLILRESGVPLDDVGPIAADYEIGRSFPAARAVAGTRVMAAAA